MNIFILGGFLGAGFSSCDESEILDVSNRSLQFAAILLLKRCFTRWLHRVATHEVSLNKATSDTERKVLVFLPSLLLRYSLFLSL